MSAFWTFARRMLRFRLMVATALSCAALSAAGLGVSLLGIFQIVEIILGQEKDLPMLATHLNERLPASVQIPEGVIALLPTDPHAAVVWLVVGLSLLALVGEAAGFCHQFLSIRVVHRTIREIRGEVFDRVVRLPLMELVRRGVADTISRMVNDTTVLAVGLTALLSKAIAQIGKGAAALVMAFVFDWRLTLIALVTAPVLYGVIRTISRKIRRASRKALESQADLYQASTEALQALRVVKVYTSEAHESARFDRINGESIRQMVKARVYRALSSPLNELLALLALGGIVIIASGFILDGRMEISTFMMTLGSLGIAAASLKPLSGMVHQINEAGAAAERICAVLEAPQEPGHDAGLPVLARHRESIRFEGVRFCYPQSRTPALDGIDLVIAHGETVAVVGPNGSGKTTLLSLVPRLFDPQDGCVRIDGTDIRDVSIESLRRQIGVVTQETVVFRATIAENIRYGTPGATDEQVREAARRARADEFIEALPGAYESVVGERGSTLSGGQRQRLAIARAILRDPAILILDEATSMIDADSEAKITQAMSEFARGRTCLIVAHRLSTVLGADRIVVMDGGRIVDQGSHDELLERCETYRLIARHQLVAAGES